MCETQLDFIWLCSHLELCLYSMVVKTLDNVEIKYNHHKTSGVSLMARKGLSTRVYASFSWQ